ncbi:MAG: radical SAM/SPASM domain-containing protein [Candidatus Scalindua sp.]
MIFKNPYSSRENPFSAIYDSRDFKAVLQHKDRLRKFPFLVDIELTNYCNLKCIFCGQQAMTREKGFISEWTFQKIIDECSLYNTPVRFIRWGEPFLHEKIMDFCKYTKSEGLPLHITSNGLTTKEDDMKALIDMEVDSLIFSFQGATKEQYEIMRNNKLHDNLKSNILKLIEIRGDKPKPFIHISSTVTDESEREIENFVNFWGHIVDSVGIGKTNLSRMPDHKIKSAEMVNKVKILRKQETIEKEYRPCNEVYQKLSVNWDGKVTCCCGDYDDFLIVGNISDDTLYNIWNNSSELKAFRELLDNMLHRSLSLCSTCYHAY